MLTLDQLRAKVEANEVDTVVTAFTDHYGRVHGKRFDAEHFVEHTHDHGTHGCDYLLTVDMEMEPVPGYRYANWELGYGDFHMVPDLSTLRIASWLDSTALVLCDLHGPHDHELVPVAPRSILKRQLARAADLGYAAKAASELEYYLYEDSYRDAAERRYADLRPTGWYIEDYHLLQGSREEHYNQRVRRHLAASGIPVENSKGEWGRGQHEMNIAYADVLTMADRHTVMKLAMKEIADRLGTSVTFMAKPDAAEAGSSCHVHLSLWSGDEAAFPGDIRVGPVSGSDAFRWFLGGWISHVEELMAFFAPTINSYKRYQDGSWAPTRIAWSYDNRTAGFRVVGHDESLRIECRIPGADCEPLSHVRRSARRRNGRRAQRDRATADLRRRRLPSPGAPPRGTNTPRGHGRLCEQRFRGRCVRPRRARALRPLLPHGATRVRQRRDRLGEMALLRTDLRRNA